MREATFRIDEFQPDLLLVGSRLGDGDPSELLRQAHARGVRNTMQIDDDGDSRWRSDALGPDLLGALVRGLEDAREERRSRPGGGEDPPLLDLKPGISLREAERRLILTTLAHHGGQRAATARSLGIKPDRLHDRLREYGYQVAEPGDSNPEDR